MPDDRLSWMTEKLKWGMPKVEASAFLDCIENPATVELVSQFCETDSVAENRCSVIFFYQEQSPEGRFDAVGSDPAFDDPDRMQRTRHQRLNVSLDHLPPDLALTENLCAMYFLKHSPEPITKAQMEGQSGAAGNVMEVGVEYSAFDCPRLQTLQQLMMHVYLPLVEGPHLPKPAEALAGHELATEPVFGECRSSLVEISEDGLRSTMTRDPIEGSVGWAVSALPITRGRHQWTITVTGAGVRDVGVVLRDVKRDTACSRGKNRTRCWVYSADGALRHGRSEVPGGEKDDFGEGDAITVDLDVDAGTLEFSKNGTRLKQHLAGVHGGADGAVYPATSFNQRDGCATVSDYRTVSSLDDSGDKLTALQSQLLEDVKNSMGRLDQHIKTVVHQVSGDRKLHIPTHIDIKDTPAEIKAAQENDDLVQEIDEAVLKWNTHISHVIEQQQQNDQATGKNPLSEIDFWKEKYAVLSAIYEQLALPQVKTMLKVLKESDQGGSYPNFEISYNNLSKMYFEAKDNVKFLSTLERHFRAITSVTPGKSLQPIIDTLPSMMTAIRMVWTISRYYNTDEKMMRLLEKIANTIAEKVSRHIHVKSTPGQPSILSVSTPKGFEEAKQKILEGQTVLEQWQKSYQKTRQDIEQTERDARWEFDKKRLFHTTDYMAKRCHDLYDIVDRLEYYHTVLGSQLKRVTKDTLGIEGIMKKVDDLKKPIETVAFDIFDDRANPSWTMQFDRFKRHVESMNTHTRQFIENSFRSLRSAEDAFDLLCSFKNLPGRSGGDNEMNLGKLIHKKGDGILERYLDEVKDVEAIFKEHHESPPLTKNQPPVAGAIHWSESLFQRIKGPIKKFLDDEDSILGTPKGKEVRKRYVQVAKMMKDYAAEHYENWKSATELHTILYLKASILRKEPHAVSGESTYAVNFDNNLFQIIQEAKYLDRLGYEVPAIALQATLLDEKYHDFVETLKSMLARYHETLAAVEPPERAILGEHIEHLEVQIEPGHKTLNWNSLGIKEYINKALSAIGEFHAKSKEIHKNSTHIAQVINHISSTWLVDPAKLTSTGNEGLLDLNDLAESLEKYRNSQVSKLTKQYARISPLLRKIEGIVTNTTTGKANDLKSYYYHWERKIYKALNRMVMVSLSLFLSFLNINPSKRHRSTRKPAPLFKVTASLVAGEIGVSPEMKEILHTLTAKIMNNIIEATKQFVRWMDGTCIECTQGEIHPKPADDSEYQPFTFYNDISKGSQVIAFKTKVNQGIQKTFFYVHKHLQSWRKYKDLWHVPKDKFIDRLGQKNLPWLEYDARFADFTRLIRGLDQYPQEKNIDFLCLDCNPLLAEIQREAREWIRLEGKQLNEQFKAKLDKLNQRIGRYRDELEQPTQDIDDLRKILSTIDDMMSKSMDIELQYREIENCYSTLRQYNIDVSQDEWDLAMGLRGAWDRLKARAKAKDGELIESKTKFRGDTVRNVNGFKRELEGELDEFRKEGPGMPGMDLDKGLESMGEWNHKLVMRKKKRDEFVRDEKLFGLEISSYPPLISMEEELFRLSFVYDLYADWAETMKTWSSTQWGDIQIDQMQRSTEGMMKKLKEAYKKYGELAPFSAMQETVRNFFNSLPLFRQLKNEALRERHWKLLMDATGKTFDFSSFTLSSLVEMRPFEFEEQINVIVAGASRELNIELSIKGIREHWSKTSFELHKKARCHLLGDPKEITEMIDEHIMALQSIANFKWVKPFIDEVRLWERKLNTMTDVIHEWLDVQTKWNYLQSIFAGGEDIAAQLPREAKKFDDLDKKWINIMKMTAENRNVDVACHQPDRLGELKWISDKLDECQKGLTDYLNTKRLAFSRFFFISDDDLLSILSSSNPRAVQEYMLKMFDNTSQLHFKPGTGIVEGGESQERETVAFDNPVNTDGHPVETWLELVLQESKRTLRGLLKAAVYYYPKKPRLQWIDDCKGMCSLAGSKVWWTYQVEDAFMKVKKGKKNAVKDLVKKLTSQIEEMVQEMDKQLGSQYRKKVNTMIIVDVHGRDIVDRFVRDAILDAREFAWESQLRFEWKKDVDNCVVKQCTAFLNYGYEFMGLNGRLVITPLTDRCFMTLTQALSYHLGGAPGGPAGTGKTESVKDLAKSLSYWCVVFNCGEGLDFRAMAAIFSGLCQCGAWGCFDEFNRIELPVLSVVAEQLRSMQNALRWGEPYCEIQGATQQVRVDGNVGVFITMNPGYAGRVELPDNLKALFRPVVMVVPNLELIAEIMLYAEGFVQARMLAKKMVTLYKLAKGQLSKQYHYDWGLRALKAVLVMAGSLKRRDSELPEDVVLMRALRDMNAPKFVFEDVPLFAGLISDLFPGLDATRVPNEKLSRACREAMNQNRDMIVANQIDKVVQLFETMQTRHTSMIVGPTSGGKTTVLQYLRLSQNALKLETKIFTLNAKAQHISRLYGVLDPVSRTWTDGIFSNIFRQINKDSEKDKESGIETTRRYVCFDGDVDALWVENMNTVMDDNKLLTLANGDRIRLNNPMCSLLFEVGDLQYASPATVSRVGMVYVDPQNLGWQPYVHKWVASRSKEEQDNFKELFDKYVGALKAFVLDGLDLDGQVVKTPQMAIPLTDCNMVKQLCLILQCMIRDTREPPEQRCLEGAFLFACTWSFGAAIVEDDRPRFDALLKAKSGQNLQPSEDLKPVSAGQLPEKRTLFDFCFSIEQSRWIPWKDSSMVPEYEPPPDGKFSSILVPTMDTVRNSYFLDLIVDRQQADPKTGQRMPILYVGASGTAKTVTIQKYLRVDLKEKDMSSQDSDKEEVRLNAMILDVVFSSRTNSVDVQRTLEENVEKRTVTILGAPPGKRLIVFIDDINMPAVDTYGTQQPIAWLKLLFEFGGWYDRKDLNFKQIRDLQYVSAMAPPGGGRNSLDPRFVSLYAVFNITFPSDDAVDSIYTKILQRHVQEFPGGGAEKLMPAVGKICGLTMDVYKLLIKTLPPTPAKFHYIFNLRDLSRVFEGMCRMTADKFETPSQMIRLWRNEMLRVFHDRMPVVEDKMVVINRMEHLVKEHFPQDQEEILAEPLLIGDFRDFDADERICLYEDMGDYESVKTVADQILDDYNTPIHRMSLVMFKMAIDHLVRIVRVLTLPRGNALLVGVGGSGKQSLTKLSAHAAGINTLFEITISRGYNEESFREDLKELYRKVGVEDGGGKVCFLFTDAHVAKEAFLESINNMLASGMVPALFADDEKDALYNAVADECDALGLAPNKENKWNLFVNRCRDNLHIVLAMSPSGDQLRVRCRNFPGLVNNTVIDWFTKWPDQALKAVSDRFIDEWERKRAELKAKQAMKDMGTERKDVDDQFSAAEKQFIVDHMVHAHMLCDDQATKFKEQMKRMHFVTPKNFLDFIKTYTQLLDQNRTRLDEARGKLRTGLDKLKDASETVVEMRVKMSEQRVLLDEMTKANEDLVADLTKKQADAEKKSQITSEREKEVAKTKSEALQHMEEVEQVLDAARPAVLEAERKLDQIEKKDMDELKSFSNVSEKIQKVAEMYCILVGKEPSWKSCKADLQLPNFINEKLKKFPKDSLTQKKVDAVKKIEERAKDLNDQSIQMASRAAAGLYIWIHSLLSYYAVAKKVEPTKALANKLEKNLHQLERELEYTRAEVEAINDMKVMLTERLQKGQAEAAKLESDARTMEKRLNNATRLISGLESERQRWTEDFDKFGKQRMKLVGDCVIGAAFLSYLGAFTFEYRKQIIDDLREDVQAREIDMSADFGLERMLANEVLVSKWNAEGLPADELSVQNGILAQKAPSFPLCIDPQKQAVNWIKRMYEKSSKFDVASFSEPNFVKRLESAIQYGQPFLFENVDEFIDPIIDPVLEKRFIFQSGQKLVKLGDKQVEWDDNFRLYMTSKLSNPNYAPEVFGKTMVINFSVTLDGLRDQLLNEVVLSERGDLARQSEELIYSMAENKQTLQQLEDTLIRELSLAQGEIIDNDDLIQTLEETKGSAEEIAKKLQDAKKTKDDIDRARQDFVPVAKRGAILFFCIAGLSAIDNMYEYSLTSFLSDVFKVSLERSEGHFESEQRLKNIIQYLTKWLYNYVCMGIFQKHVRLFAFLMTARILDGDDVMVQAELDFFLKGCLLSDKDFPPKPEGENLGWLTEKGWNDICRLSKTCDVFQNLPRDVASSIESWGEWYDMQCPEGTAEKPVDLPNAYSQRLTPFQKLCLLRCFRVDRAFLALGNFIAGVEQMGPHFAVPYKPDLKDVYQQSSCNSPIVCVTTPGANPTEEIDKLAAKMDMRDMLKSLSLGQGQGEIAVSLTEQGSVRGYWVLLCNCHLLIDFMKEIEKLLEKRDSKPHPNFRLWLTTEPTEGFPLGILQRSLKVVFEPPDGLQMNMTMTYQKVTDEILDECPHNALRPLVFTLAYFHAVVQERRKYGKLGWNVVYDFNETDFTISMRLMSTYLTKSHVDDAGIPWETLRYLVGEAMYGGRVTDDWDRRIVSTYLQEYLGDFLFDTFQPFHFFKNVPSGIDYCLPLGSTDLTEPAPREEYVKQILTMRNDNSPEVFGLHANAEIGYLTTMTKTVWENYLLVQASSGGGSGGGMDAAARDAKLSKLASDILDSIPKQFDRKWVMMDQRKKHQATGLGDGVSLSPTQVVLLQELERWNGLVALMVESLKELMRALAGVIGMSPELDSIATSLLNGQIPPSWRRRAPDTRKGLGRWLIHFQARFEQYDAWIKQEEPIVMWISGLMVPDSYIAALVQTTCRKYRWPLDKSDIFVPLTSYTSADQVKERPKDGAFISGLYIEGARWDVEEMCLAPQHPKKLIQELPILEIQPKEVAKIKRAGTFTTPVYVTQGRKAGNGVGWVFSADVATQRHYSHWVLQSVACCLNSDD
eukprot:TRINITY_DN5358_c0_g3_i1.p1 TRINITY_DN5358_c0_g3~~TRINITY_DN5358_c0_g3_i1.p1  ORF type:complete len:4876 (+),score=1837.91 TRINITY_DN5358_c0_g3_i1:119-14629(+)